VQTRFEHRFPFIRLSRARAKDKAWITASLRKSSKIKSKLYEKWLQTKDQQDETKYKQYKRTFRKVALEEMYCREMFDTRTEFCQKNVEKFKHCLLCPKKSNCTTNNISKLIIKGSTLTDDNSISNGINNYFATIAEKRDEEHSQIMKIILM